VRVLVDTSVWVDFFNGSASPEADSLAAYLSAEAELATCGLIISELFQGFRDSRTIRELEPYFRDLYYLFPNEPDTYFAAARTFRELRARGVTVRSTVDCLLVRLAEEHDCWLLGKDRDFRLIVRSGLTGVTLAPAAPPSEGDS
jgi:predicted nucleic acid-binding protein